MSLRIFLPDPRSLSVQHSNSSCNAIHSLCHKLEVDRVIRNTKLIERFILIVIVSMNIVNHASDIRMWVEFVAFRVGAVLPGTAELFYIPHFRASEQQDKVFRLHWIWIVFLRGLIIIRLDYKLIENRSVVF